MSANVTPTAKKYRVALVMPSDFDQWPTGGGLPTVKIFLKYARHYPFDITLFGLSWRLDEKLGQVYSRRIHGTDYPFIPIYRVSQEDLTDRRPLIPLRLQTLGAFWQRRSWVLNRAFDLLYLHAPELLPLMAPKHRPILYNFHGIEEAGAQYSRYGIFRSTFFLRVYQHIIAFIVHRGDQFICVDEESYRLYTMRWPERAADFHLVWTAIDLDNFKWLPDARSPKLKASLGLPVDKRIVLFVGRLSEKKGVSQILQAFAGLAPEHEDLALVIVGNGEEREVLEAQVSNLNLVGRVVFLGKVDHDKLPSFYNSADVSVVASAHESLGLIITEALACGTPVVSTRVGIAPHVIRDGETGFIASERTPAALREGVRAALQLGPGAADKCVAAAAPYGHTSEKICQVMLEMCEHGVEGQRIVGRRS